MRTGPLPGGHQAKFGGTFTDYVLLDDRSDELLIHKRPTTPSDPAEGALLGLQELVERSGRDLGDCGILVHGTTLVSNSLIERRRALTTLLTTRGFRDILEMGHDLVKCPARTPCGPPQR